MRIVIFTRTALTLPLVCSGPLAVATFTAPIVDQGGAPVANAVLALMADGKSATAPSKRLASDKIIDQRNERLIPPVTMAPKTGRKVFTNTDKTNHQVYSVSPINQFEITLSPGERPSPFAFDTSGAAALFCRRLAHP
jgi:hypothetical protein